MMGFEEDQHGPDLYQLLYGDNAYGRHRNHRYGGDFEPEFTGDLLPDRHGLKYQFATGCRCDVCVAACEQLRDQTSEHRQPTGPMTVTLEERQAA